MTTVSKPPRSARAAMRVRRVGASAKRTAYALIGPDPIDSTVDVTAPLPYDTMVYFADPPVNLYQIRQWLAPIERHAQRHPTVVVCRSYASYKALQTETSLPVIYLRTSALLDELAMGSDIRLALYVNQNMRNFQTLRYGDMAHVFLSHGESDKVLYMATNQVKAYDATFVAGSAAVARLNANLVGYDAEANTFQIGRPQLDVDYPSAHARSVDRTTVLYAPTWEGDRPSTNYGSVASHGEQIVRAFLGTGRHRLVYRPHPRNGAVDRSYGRADRAVRALIRDAAKADPAAGHRVDTDPFFGPQIPESDVMICDVSAVGIDYLASGKPLFVTTPVNPAALVDSSGVMGVAYPVALADLPGLRATVDARVADDIGAVDRQPWVSHYFGDTSPGACMDRFLSACEAVLKRQEERIAARDAGRV